MSYSIELVVGGGGRVSRRLLPKVYKTLRGAERAAARMGWVCKPDGVTTTAFCRATVVAGGAR